MKAIIPCAGQGSRFFPWSRYTPKEMLPLVNVPAVVFTAREAVYGGCDHVVFVISKGKEALASCVEDVPCTFSYTYQAEPLGLGHAILQAAPIVGDEPFCALLPDDIYSPNTALQRLVRVHHETNKAVVALMPVERSEAHKYGIVDASRAGGHWRIHNLVEKPTEGIPAEPLAVVGRYVLPGRTFGILEDIEPGHGGEIQLTDALRVLAQQGELIGLECPETRYDIGTPKGWLQANIEFGRKAGLLEANHGS